MYNGDIIFRQNINQYDSEIYEKYNNFYIPYKYNMKPINNCKCYFSSEEENCNLKANYILTENTINTTINNIDCKSNSYRYKILNKFNNNNSSYSNSQKNFHEREYQVNSGKSKEDKGIEFSRQNNNLFNNNVYITLNSGTESNFSKPKKLGNINYILFNKQNINHTRNYSNKKNTIINTTNPFNNSKQGEINSYYNINKETYSKCNPSFTKHKSHTLFNYENHNSKDNNNLYNECNDKNENREKSSFNSGYRDNKYDSKIYYSGNNITINDESYIITNNSKINYIRDKYCNNSNNGKPNKVISSLKNISIYNNNYTKNQIFRNRTHNNSNIKENKTYNPPPIDKGPNSIKIENFNINNRIRNFYNGNKRKINLVLNSIEKNNNNNTFNKANETNKIKNIRMANISTYNDNSIEKKNHSFYEVKSFSKDIVNQKSIKVKLRNINPISRIVSKKKTEENIKNNNEKIFKYNRNDNKLKEYNYLNSAKINLRTRKINLGGLNRLNNIVKKEENFYNQNKVNKSIYENSNKSLINKKEINSMKENININMTYNNENIFNNNISNISNIIESKLKKNSKIILNINKIKLKSLPCLQGNKQIERINNLKNMNKRNIINKKINNNKISEFIKKRVKGRMSSASELYCDKSKLINIKKIQNEFFTYIPNSKDNKIDIKKEKKTKKKYNKLNIIQLKNINHKLYEEDFPLKNNRYRIFHRINKFLKPQISFRISLFGIKEPEKEKYFIVNLFYSENLRKKPEEIESDF